MSRGNDQLTEELNRIFASQIVGGKRYDLAVEGRKRANATFCDPTGPLTDRKKVWYALDLTPLIIDPSLSITGFIDHFLSRFTSDVHDLLTSQMPEDSAAELE